VVRGCQVPKRISAEPRGARKRVRWGSTERSCTSGLYSGSELRAILRRVKHVELRNGWTVITTTWRKNRASVSSGIHEGFHRAGLRDDTSPSCNQDSVGSPSLGLTFNWLTQHSATPMSSRSLPKYFAWMSFPSGPGWQ